MATVTSLLKSVPLNAYYFDVSGIVNGSQTITLPAPSLQGSFPPDGQWTPTEVWCMPYNTAATGALVTPDLTTIVNTNGAVTFTVNAAGVTNCRMLVW